MPALDSAYAWRIEFVYATGRTVLDSCLLIIAEADNVYERCYDM
jgi:hypothetical protein